MSSTETTGPSEELLGLVRLLEETEDTRASTRYVLHRLAVAPEEYIVSGESEVTPENVDVAIEIALVALKANMSETTRHWFAAEAAAHLSDRRVIRVVEVGPEDNEEGDDRGWAVNDANVIEDPDALLAAAINKRFGDEVFSWIIEGQDMNDLEEAASEMLQQAEFQPQTLDEFGEYLLATREETIRHFESVSSQANESTHELAFAAEEQLTAEQREWITRVKEAASEGEMSKAIRELNSLGFTSEVKELVRLILDEIVLAKAEEMIRESQNNVAQALKLVDDYSSSPAAKGKMREALYYLVMPVILDKLPDHYSEARNIANSVTQFALPNAQRDMRRLAYRDCFENARYDTRQGKKQAGISKLKSVVINDPQMLEEMIRFLDYEVQYWEADEEAA